MFSIITGSLIISLLHAVIPNHWLPVLAIGKKEEWTLKEVTEITFFSALAHALSTVLIGLLLSLVGLKMAEKVSHFTHLIAPVLLVLLGLYFIHRHHYHKHFHIDEKIAQRKSKIRIIATLMLAMFLSPCMEIEAYFLLAGAKSKWLVLGIAAMYILITTSGIILLVRYTYKGLLKLNWHKLEHNAGIITGITLVVTGIITFFIQ